MSKTSLNLNEVYRKDLIWYWCNATGDINMPGFPPLASPSSDNLPRAVGEIYYEFWKEGAGACEYVVTFNGRHGLLLGWLFDYSWLVDLNIAGRHLTEGMRDLLHDSVSSAADKLAEGFFSPSGEAFPFSVLYGRDTDPDGDEILIFIPQDALRRKGEVVEECRDIIGNLLYDYVEEEMKRNASE